MASKGHVGGSMSNLNHVYVFVNRTCEHQDPDPNSSNSAPASDELTQHRSRAPSQGSATTTETGTTGIDTNTNASSSSSPQMNPSAKSFQPRPPAAPTAPQLYDIRSTNCKGLGLFATCFIPRGTLIICDKPLLKVDQSSTHFVWGAYCRLGNAEKQAYDSLHCFQPEYMNLDFTARRHLIDSTDDSLDKEDVEELVADQVRVMSIFSVNNFHVPPNHVAVFSTATRLNHSCVPNVHHSYNPTLQQLTVYAVRDILPNEQLYTTYIGGDATYETQFERAVKLREGYGFICDCSACMDHSKESDGRREVIGNLVWAIEQFGDGERGNGAQQDSQQIPESGVAALAKAEQVIGLMLEEGLFTIELTKAYRTASILAFQAQDFEKAKEYAKNEAEVERNCLGLEVGDLVKRGVAAQCWNDRLREFLRRVGVEDSVKKGMSPSKAVKQMGTAKTRKQKQRGEKAGKGVGMGK